MSEDDPKETPYLLTQLLHSANNDGRTVIHVRDLLLVILAETESILKDVLQSLDVHIDSLREQVKDNEIPAEGGPVIISDQNQEISLSEKAYCYLKQAVKAAQSSKFEVDLPTCLFQVILADKNSSYAGIFKSADLDIDLFYAEWEYLTLTPPYHFTQGRYMRDEITRNLRQAANNNETTLTLREDDLVELERGKSWSSSKKWTESSVRLLL